MRGGPKLGRTTIKSDWKSSPRKPEAPFQDQEESRKAFGRNRSGPKGIRQIPRRCRSPSGVPGNLMSLAMYGLTQGSAVTSLSVTSVIIEREGNVESDLSAVQLYDKCLLWQT